MSNRFILVSRFGMVLPVFCSAQVQQLRDEQPGRRTKPQTLETVLPTIFGTETSGVGKQWPHVNFIPRFDRQGQQPAAPLKRNVLAPTVLQVPMTFIPRFDSQGRH